MFQQSQAELSRADQRIAQLEDKLTLAGDESNASVTALQASLKEAHSEIGKLWGVAYDRNRKSIQANKNAAAAARADSAKLRKNLETLQAELKVMSDLVDAQQGALTSIEQAGIAQQRELSSANAAIQRKVNDVSQQVQVIEEDIKAINGFRRSVTQQLLELQGGATAP
jgi:chromosome segregation ATPase